MMNDDVRNGYPSRADLEKEMKPLVLPQINLNGSLREVLVSQQLRVLDALRALQAAMQEASPNGRDYQTMPMGTLNKAQEAWRERWVMIDALYKEIEAHALAIHDDRPY